MNTHRDGRFRPSAGPVRQVGGSMMRLVAPALVTALLAACAPPRWAEGRCHGQLDTWELPEPELASKLRPLTDEQLLDLAACNMATSHPSRIGISERFVTERSSTISDSLLRRLEAEDEGLISMGYVDLLEAILDKEPHALSATQRAEAKAQCMRHYQSTSSCAAFE